MELSQDFDLDGMLDGIADDIAPPPTTRALPGFLRKIPVTLTLEVGSAEVSLAELAAISQGSVLELDTLAGAPLDIKVNGSSIGKAEVVVSGDSYGLRVLSLSTLDLDALTP